MTDTNAIVPTSSTPIATTTEPTPLQLHQNTINTELAKYVTTMYATLVMDAIEQQGKSTMDFLAKMREQAKESEAAGG